MSEKKKSYFSPISLRISPEEKARLERDAGGMTVSAYIREQLFGEHVVPRKRRMKKPVKDHRTIAQLFALIKQTQCWNNLNQIARETTATHGLSRRKAKKRCKRLVKPSLKSVPC